MLISLSQLDAKYQQVALSALNLSNAERQEINTKLQGLAAGSLMTGQQMQELLMDTNLDAATKKRILSETGLTNAIGASTIATRAHVLSQLEELRNSGAITPKIYEAITAKMADTAATNTMTGANMGLAASFKTLMASIPVWGWIALAISAVISVLQTVIPMIKSSSEQLEETAGEFETTADEITSLNNELQTTQDRIDELKSKGKLSFTDASEVKRLKAENAEREHTIWLLEEENKKRTKKAQRNFNDMSFGGIDFNSPLYFLEKSDNWFSRFLQDFGDSYSSGNFLYGDNVEILRDRLNDLFKSGYEYGTNVITDENIDNIYRIVDAYDAWRGATDTLFSSIYYRDKFSEARTAIEELGTVTAESLVELYKDNDKVKELVDYLLSLGTIDWKTVLGKDFDRVAADDGIVSTAEALDWMDEKSENSAKVMGLLANEFNEVGDAAYGAANSISSLSKAYDSLKESVEPLSKAYEEMTQNGSLSADTLFTLLGKYPELISNIEIENGLYKINNNLLEKQFELIKQNRIAELEKTNAKLIAARKNITATKEEIKAEIDLVKAKLVSAEVSGVNVIDLANLKLQLHILEEFEKYEKSIAMLSNLNLSNISSSSSQKSPEEKRREEAEKYFDELKYRLETNQITEEQYLKKLDAAYKKYYGDKSKYLEEYAEYSQEVYDGFKDMYQEDLEAQKDAWEEKKDAVSEYYDNLREQIEDAHDEEDYEKEQSEKRKEIFDLDMQIAELMRDGSEKAKARIAELEEERLKAEEELLDFETDKAREDELSRLEKEQEAEEKKIQDKIDGIQEQLDKLDEDTISVRNAIIAYAKEKGVTLDFAYASGTRASVGGFGRINEKGIEMISAPDGNGNYIPMLPNSYVFSAKATEFLWKLATEHSLPQAMYNSIAKSIKTQSSTPSVNIAQPITITMGDVIIKGNADKQTVADIKKQQENTVRMVLQKIKELQK